MPGGLGAAPRDDVREAGLLDLDRTAENCNVLLSIPIINILDLQITYVKKLDDGFSGDRFFD